MYVSCAWASTIAMLVFRERGPRKPKTYVCSVNVGQYHHYNNLRVFRERGPRQLQQHVKFVDVGLEHLTTLGCDPAILPLASTNYI